MKILVTAGNTLVPIDRVRGITNIFTGRTGATIALHAHRRGHEVILLTSHPETAEALRAPDQSLERRWSLRHYFTFDDLRERMHAAVQGERLDVVIHSAAVSDYRTVGVFAPAPGTSFHAESASFTSLDGSPRFLDRVASKVKSDENELWLRLTRTPKLVDMLRPDWGFRGLLVKFKLEVEVSEDRLLEIAERSRTQSGADLMVANTLEGASQWALLGPIEAQYQKVTRHELADRLLARIETLYRDRLHG